MAEIIRDEYGVPHIYGKDIADTYFGYGYAVAEDRLFQLEMRRRQATGTIAEVYGEALDNTKAGGTAVFKAIDQDKRNRREYYPQQLLAQFKVLAQPEQQLINGYLQGLNQRIQEVIENTKLIPSEFEALWGQGVAEKKLRPWHLEELLVAATNAMSSYISHTDMDKHAELFEKLRLYHTKRLSDPAEGLKTAQAIFDTLNWVNDPYAPTTLDGPLETVALAPPRKPQQQPQPAPNPLKPPIGSLPGDSVQVDAEAHLDDEAEASTMSLAILVGGKLTGGSSIQLNGPQPGFFFPSYFYTVGLHAADGSYDVVGHAPGGFLAITTGDNGTIAWGSTSAGGDHTVYFNEVVAKNPKASPNSPNQYMYHWAGEPDTPEAPAGFRPVFTSESIIDAKGKPPNSNKITIHRTHRGVFVGDVIAPSAVTTKTYLSKQVLWRGRELTSLMAWIRAGKAKDWDTFRREGSRMAMGYNWFYSDIHGNIGYIFGGFFPDETQSPCRYPGFATNPLAWQTGSITDPRFPAAGGLPLFSQSLAEVYHASNRQGDSRYDYIVNWNNKPADRYNNRDLHVPRWSQADRVNILYELMEQKKKEVEAQRRFFTDKDVLAVYQEAAETDVMFRYFRPMLAMIDAKTLGNKPTVAKALELLLAWNGKRVQDPQNNQRYDQPGVAIFLAWVPEIVKRTVGANAFPPPLPPSEEPNAPQDPFTSLIRNTYTGTGIAAHNKNSQNIGMGTKIALRALQAYYGMRPFENPTYDMLGGASAETKMIEALEAACATLAAKLKEQDPAKWRQPMLKQVFYPENYDGVPTATVSPTRPVFANRGSMQRIAVGSKGGMQSRDANPPGVISTSKELDLYAGWNYKPLALHPPGFEPGKGKGKVIPYSLPKL